ncbi:MAG: T9SS type A sorting domain-containing protein [Bacteroidota bacterium]|nr:T9SS type A sorting domain-containing protein [Bacteroidota bacterium]
MKIYDIKGKEVSTLTDQHQEAGYHTISFDGSDISSGIYFYMIVAGNFTSTMRMLLLK